MFELSLSELCGSHSVLAEGIPLGHPMKAAQQQGRLQLRAELALLGIPHTGASLSHRAPFGLDWALRKHTGKYFQKFLFSSLSSFFLVATRACSYPRVHPSLINQLRQLKHFYQLDFEYPDMQRKVKNILVLRMKLQNVVALSVVLLLTFANFHISYHISLFIVSYN